MNMSLNRVSVGFGNNKDTESSQAVINILLNNQDDNDLRTEAFIVSLAKTRGGSLKTTTRFPKKNRFGKILNVGKAKVYRTHIHVGRRRPQNL